MGKTCLFSHLPSAISHQAGFFQRPVRINGNEIRRGSPELLDDIATCLNRNGRRYQFAPCWTAADLCSFERTRGLSIADFVVATRGAEVVGCAAYWDQRAFKQVVVRRYSPRIARWRYVANLLARVTGAPTLPRVGSRLEFAYLSHFAVDDDRADVATALLSAARSRVLCGANCLVTGFADRSPLLLTVARQARHRAYRTLLYAASWPDGQNAVNALDGRLPHPEVAIL